MSDTPETDYEVNDKSFIYTMGGLPPVVVHVEFARKLERECNDLREIFPKILEALESGSCAATCSVDFLREIPREVRLVRQRLERERDEARKKTQWKQSRIEVLLRLNQKLHSELTGSQDNDLQAELAAWELLDEARLERDLWKAEAERWRDCQKDD